MVGIDTEIAVEGGRKFGEIKRRRLRMARIF